MEGAFILELHRHTRSQTHTLISKSIQHHHRGLCIDWIVAKHSGHYALKPPTIFADKSPAITVKPCNIPTSVRSPSVALALIHILILRNLNWLWHKIYVPVFGEYKSLMLTSTLLNLFCYMQWIVWEGHRIKWINKEINTINKYVTKETGKGFMHASHQIQLIIKYK